LFIFQWRAEKKKLEKEKTGSARETILANLDLPVSGSNKKWSLEEDDDDDDEAAKNDGEDGDGEDDEDPLDKYMAEVNKEVRKLKGSKPASGVKKSAVVAKKTEDAGGKKGVVIMMGVAKKKMEDPRCRMSNFFSCKLSAELNSSDVCPWRVFLG
jgi:hypothetical protein